MGSVFRRRRARVHPPPQHESEGAVEEELPDSRWVVDCFKRSLYKDLHGTLYAGDSLGSGNGVRLHFWSDLLLSFRKANGLVRVGQTAAHVTHHVCFLEIP